MWKMTYIFNEENLVLYRHEYWWETEITNKWITIGKADRNLLRSLSDFGLVKFLNVTFDRKNLTQEKRYNVKDMIKKKKV